MFDRVWFCRESSRNLENAPKDICKKHDEELKRIKQQYGLDEFPIDDWQYGYWSGVMAALRWALGDEKDSLDT